MTTVLSCGKGAGLNEFIAHSGRIARQRETVGTEAKIVGLPDLIGVALAFEAGVRLRGLSVESEMRGDDQQGNADRETSRTADDSDPSELHFRNLPGKNLV